MTTAIHPWRIRIGAIAWFLAGLAFLLALPILLQAWIFLLPLVILVAVLVALPIAWLWNRFTTHRGLRRAWFKWTVALTCLIAFLLALPVYYFASATQFSPALVPQVTLTNGQKRIVFQGMQHVGSDAFYKSVVFDLEDALTRGHVLYYEGVRPSTPDNDRWFAQRITHGKDLSSAYRQLSQLCGLRFQSDYLEVVTRDGLAHPDKHIVADVSTADLKGEYDRLMASDPAFAAAMKQTSEPADTDNLETIVAKLDTGTQRQRDIAGIICRGFMSRAMNLANDPTQRDALDPLILDFRNRVLAERLLAEPRHQIYLTYGAKHLPGVFALLKKADPEWRVASVKWLRTIDSPETYSAALPGVPAPR